MKELKESSDLAIVWFENNYGKLNTNNCQALVFGHLRQWLEVTRFRKTKSLTVRSFHWQSLKPW